MLTYENCVSMFSRNVRNNRRKLANNTYLYRTKDNAFAVRLHNTDVVTIHADNTYTLRTSGWRTVTTKARINHVSPARIVQEKEVWYVRQSTNWENWKDTRIVFAEGMRVDNKGMAINYSRSESDTNEQIDKEIVKTVREYIKGAADYFVRYVSENGTMPESTGDCLYCQMREVGTGKTLGSLCPNSDHIALHMLEKYYQTSMLANACDVWNGGAVAPTVLIDLRNNRTELFTSVMRKYLKSQLASIRQNWASAKAQIADSE